jgi:predicted transcriptional regulator of viral defense system
MTFLVEKCHLSPHTKGMNKQQESKLKKLGIFTLEQAEKLGISQQSLSRFVEEEKIKRVARGIYLHPAAHLDGDVGFQIAGVIFGADAAIGGISALYHYNLAEQVPGHIWVVVPPQKRTAKYGYKLIRTKVRLDKEIRTEHGYRIVSVERAILEGLKFITKIGERIAIKAARNALAKGQTTELKLGKAAKELGLESVLIKYLEVIVP